MKPTYLLLALSLLAVPAAAYGYDHGRLRYAEAGATLQRGTETGAEEATPNSPFFPGDRIWTDAVGRAEFQFPDGSVLRLDSRSKLDYVAHDESGRDESVVLRLWSGSLILRVSGARRPPRFEIEAPGGLVTIEAPGIYRVDAEVTETRLSVYDGEAVFDAARRRLTVDEGETVFVRRGEWPDGPRRFDRDRLDEFGSWDVERAELEDDRGGRSARYLPPEVAPYASEFDDYGNWHYETEVGYVWVPTVHVGWRPYWNGRWCWTIYGWTWVPYEPWGWGPSHYGRWGFSAGLGWYWIPGGVWSPAWVSWAVGGDYVGWCPLGHRDRPVIGFDRAVPRSGSLQGHGPAWAFVRRADLPTRDLAKRRLEAGAFEAARMRFSETPHLRPTRDLRSLEAAAATAMPHTGHEGPGPRHTVHELRADPRTPIPWPGAVRRDRETTERSSRSRQGAAPELRGGTKEPPARPRSEEARPRWDWQEGAAARRAPAGDEGRPGASRSGRPAAEPRGEAPAPAREQAPSRHREPDREVMRQLFKPLTEPRAPARRDGGEAPPPRSEPRARPEERGSHPSPSREPSPRTGSSARPKDPPRR
jgi:hypothetical protein